MLVDDKWISKWQPVETVDDQDGFVRPPTRWAGCGVELLALLEPRRPSGSATSAWWLSRCARARSADRLNDEEVLVGVPLAQRAQR
jgi:hypothetical protein